MIEAGVASFTGFNEWNALEVIVEAVYRAMASEVSLSADLRLKAIKAINRRFRYIKLRLRFRHALLHVRYLGLQAVCVALRCSRRVSGATKQ